MIKKSQLSLIRGMMLSGRWVTIPMLQSELKTKHEVHAMETTISARIRNLRLPKNGGYEVQRELAPDSKLYRYRLVYP